MRREAAEEAARKVAAEAEEALARRAAAEAEQALRAAAEERARREAAEEAARQAAEQAARKSAAAAKAPVPTSTNGQVVQREPAPVLRLAGARARLAAVRDRSRPNTAPPIVEPEVERPIEDLPLSAWLQASNGTGDRQAVSEWAEALRNKRPRAETG